MEKQPLKSLRLQMVISPEEVMQVDEWRRRQADLPSRSEAIRRLIQLGLRAAGGEVTSPNSIGELVEAVAKPEEETRGGSANSADAQGLEGDGAPEKTEEARKRENAPPSAQSDVAKPRETLKAPGKPRKKTQPNL